MLDFDDCSFCVELASDLFGKNFSLVFVRMTLCTLVDWLNYFVLLSFVISLNSSK